LISFFNEHQALLWWFGAISLGTFAGSLILVPVLVARLPPDYFSAAARPVPQWLPTHPLLRVLSLGFKNICGAILILAGGMMIFIPGQGLLTMFVGLTLLDFPGKYQLEKRIVRVPPLLRTINWIRKRKGRPEFGV
jgi:hypothetical protein